MMRILILAPGIFPNISGNAITVERWRRALLGKGAVVEALSSPTCTPAAFVERLQRFRPDIIHVHHAFKAGILLLDPLTAAMHANLAVVASPGGTDIYSDLEMPERRAAIAKVFRMAGSVIVQSAETADRIRSHMPDLDQRIVRVPKAFCWFGDWPCDLKTILGCDRRNVLFFLPAGIRPVKANLECLMAMEKVHAARPHVRFVAAGPAIEPEYAGRFEREVKRLSEFAVWIKAIPPEAMRSAYESSDVVVNASLSEGLSNSLLEAVAAERPILASNIPGNWWPVLGDGREAHTGLLFDHSGAEDLVAKAIKLIDDENLRISFSLASRARKLKLPNPEDEADGLIAAYEKALACRSRREQ
jgi:L-malate glycosyltransferase